MKLEVLFLSLGICSRQIRGPTGERVPSSRGEGGGGLIQASATRRDKGAPCFAQTTLSLPLESPSGGPSFAGIWFSPANLDLRRS